MNTRDLEYLVALSDLKHFGKAASACFVSQPALSMQIKKLEESLGVQLLERTNKSVLLTDQGSIIAERARKILSDIDEIKEISKSAKDPLSGEIKIGIFPTLAPYLLPLIVPQLSQHYPKLSFYLFEEKTSPLIEMLKEGKLHAAFLTAPIIEKNLSNSILFEEEFMLAVPIKHTLAKLKSVKQHDLKNQNLLLLEEGHCMRDQALALCHRMDITENKKFRATSLETLRHMVAAGVGITLIPKLACYTNNNIAYIPFITPKPTRTIGLFWRSSSSKQALLDNIAATIKSLLIST
ncbi:MAG: LysR family transcriptional regulator [Gammaproteobacteria bacterium]|nr:LysR family transcriptional regulator [Gammaproteobacteria bacterium]